jgi:hypothetical protein
VHASTAHPSVHLPEPAVGAPSIASLEHTRRPRRSPRGRRRRRPRSGPSGVRCL